MRFKQPDNGWRVDDVTVTEGVGLVVGTRIFGFPLDELRLLADQSTIRKRDEPKEQSYGIRYC